MTTAKFQRQAQRYSPHWAGRAEIAPSPPPLRAILPRWLARLLLG